MVRSQPQNMDRTRRKLEIALKNKEYYEAHQQSQTLWRRLIAEDKIDEACDLSLSLLPLFISAREYGSVLDIVKTAISVLNNTQEHKKLMIDFFTIIAPVLDDTSDELGPSTFHNAVSNFQHWSQKQATTQCEPIVGHAIVALLIEHNQPYEAEALLLRLPSSSNELLRVLGKSLSSNINDDKLKWYFHLRWILWVMAQGRISYALLILSWAAQDLKIEPYNQSSDKNISFYKFEDRFLSFAQCLVLLAALPNPATPHADKTAFEQLCAHFQDVACVDAAVEELVRTVGQDVFSVGVRPPNMLQEMLKGLFN